MPSIEELLAPGRDALAAGDLAAAETAFRNAVSAHPTSFDAWFLLGSVYRELSRFDEAQRSLITACQIQPERAEGYNGVGLILAQRSMFLEALSCFHEAVRRDPKFVEAQNNLAVVLGKLGRPEEAERVYREAIERSPSDPELHFNLATLLRRREQTPEAIDRLNMAIALSPGYAKAHAELGNIFAEQRQFEAARTSFEHALLLDPTLFAIRCNLATVLAALRRYSEAAALLGEVVVAAPNYIPAYLNLASVFTSMGQAEQADAVCRAALRIKPDDAEIEHALGVIHYQEGRFDDALAQYQKSLTLAPEFLEAAYSLAYLRMLRGEFEQGFVQYERLRSKVGPRDLRWSQPAWDGSLYPGKTLLVHADQGLGDAIQLARYLPAVKARGGTVIFAVQTPLLGFLASVAGADRVVDVNDLKGNPPPFDLQIPLSRLIGLLTPTIATIPATVRYLRPELSRVEHFRESLASRPGFRIGIAWQGNPENTIDRVRSIALDQFGPIASIAGVRVVSLQKADGEDQIARRSGQWPLLTPLRVPAGSADSFAEVAALVGTLDLVISADTSVAHLAGALGVPVWIALSFVPDWRWLRDREDSPWYPSARLFRQRRPGDWREVFTRITAELRATVS